MAIYNDSQDFPTAFQRQFKRGIGIGGDPQAPIRRPSDTPGPKGYNGSGLEDNPNNGFNTMGNPHGIESSGQFGGGGPMPIPDGGPGWRMMGDQNGGGGGPMPFPPPWKGKNPEDFGVTMEFGGPGAVNPVGMGPQDLRNLYNPTPPPPRPNPQMSQPPAWGNAPGLGGGLVDSWNGPPVGDQNGGGGGPMPFPPKQGGGQSGYLGGPGRRNIQPGFDFNNFGAQPQSSWNWGDPNNLRRRRF